MGGFTMTNSQKHFMKKWLSDMIVEGDYDQEDEKTLFATLNIVESSFVDTKTK